MNDRQDPYGPGEPPRAGGYDYGYGYGYDEYGRPVRTEPEDGYPAPDAGTGQRPAYDAYDPYGTYASGGYAPDPHAQGTQDSYSQDLYSRDSYAPGSYGQDPHTTGHPSGPSAYAPGDYSDPAPGTGQQPAYDPYTPYPSDTGQQPRADGVWIPQQPQAPWYEEGGGTAAGGPGGTDDNTAGTDGAAASPDGNTGADTGADGEYRTEEFSFVEEQDGETEDVIDWLKFSESRTERREEAKRRGRNRTVALVAALAVVLVGGVGWLWAAGLLPGLSGSEESGPAAGGAQKRSVIVVHLREVDGGETSTALLVNNETAGKGTTVLLPNSLAVSSAGGAGAATTLGKAFQSEGAAATRDALGLLLGTEIRGTWRLDTPYLENWVELVGGITLDADATVPGAKKGDDPLVEKGEERDLDGKAAVAYATHRAAGESQTEQLARFGQVVEATLEKMSDDPATAIKTVGALAQIHDPSLTEAQLGASLAPLAGYAKKGDHATELLPVEEDGTLSEKVSDGLVKDVLGGTVKNTDPNATPRVSLKNATGEEDAAGTARVTLVNAGYTVVGGGTGSAQEGSRVTYADSADKAKALEVARTLGLPEKSVAKGKGAANADVTVVLGGDYEPADG
ncbi:LytR C-terminal domain-containing protein [Streptomyces sp. TRM 70361]|uniref:LCP family protein n=1 Tax=Streptomyces sp. TRM 70361 TaxID=3116553 RepID=UPI002E7C16E8|nr:LytR C-terminal domain-containing protein [Streptomyces sp. TRM 70361]MEE1938155.1 LytR C-terminal domain-containing protein [Streptomyces sp. TRM 70361]